MGTHTTRITLTLSRRQAMLAGVLTGTVILLFRSWLEADMARHMLVEFPLLLVAGLATAKALPEQFGDVGLVVDDQNTQAHAALPVVAPCMRRGNRTVNSVNAPNWLSTLIVPPCCWVTMS